MSVYILQEDGGKLLQNDGSGILYESASEWGETGLVLVMKGNKMRYVLVRNKGI